MKLSKLMIGLTAIAISTGLSANSLNSCGIHTWHNVIANQGSWKVTLQIINQQEHAWFTDQNCVKINSLTVSPTNTPKFGFGFDGQADFDVAYTLTMVQDKNSSIPQFNSKACVFIVTAKGPAKPDVVVSNYNGAKCDWKVVRGVGEDFIVS